MLGVKALPWSGPYLAGWPLAGATPGVWSLHQHRSADLPSWVLVHVHCVTASKVPNLSEGHRLTMFSFLGSREGT